MIKFGKERFGFSSVSGYMTQPASLTDNLINAK